MEPVSLYLVTGFLGSGKTTLLNNLVEGLGGRRAGVIVNEFGSVNIDALRIAASGARPGEIIELNNGQIFCSCLAASFIDSVLAFAGMPVDLLLVECSGLSRPAPLDGMVREIEKRAGGRIAYRGMICVADAESYPAPSQAAAAVTEQVRCSSVILVNKTDRVSSEEAGNVLKELAALNPRARIIQTAFCKSSEDLLSLVSAVTGQGPGTLPAACASRGSTARPESLFLAAAGPVEEEAVRAFLAKVAGKTYRIKGLLATTAGNRSVDCTAGSIDINPWAGRMDSPGLVVILRHGVSSGDITGEWERFMHDAAGKAR